MRYCLVCGEEVVSTGLRRMPAWVHNRGAIFDHEPKPSVYFRKKKSLTVGNEDGGQAK